MVVSIDSRALIKTKPKYLAFCVKILCRLQDAKIEPGEKALNKILLVSVCLLSFISASQSQERQNKQNNIFSQHHNYKINGTGMWNFVKEANNLTQAEKLAFDTMANCVLEANPAGPHYIDVLAYRVRIMNSNRENKELTTNNYSVIWVDEETSRTIADYIKESMIKNNGYSDQYDVLSMGKEYTIKLGFRSDGVIVWKKEEIEERKENSAFAKKYSDQ